MENVGEVRGKIYKYFHSSKGCKDFFFAQEQEARFAAYHTCMYLLQDTTESLGVDRQNGFSADPHKAYIEFWGVMQALFIQQDSISELYLAITGGVLDKKSLTSWNSLRELRNVCAGHPAKKDRPKGSSVKRTFMGRNFGDYSDISYEQWSAPNNIDHPRINLAEKLDEYSREAEGVLLTIFESMKRQWPQ